MVLDDIIFNENSVADPLAALVAGVRAPSFGLCGVGVVEADEVGLVRSTSLM